MKKRILKSILAIALISMVLGLLSCKEMNSNDEDSSKISIDISGLLAQLPANSSSSSSQSAAQSSEVSGQLSSPPENDAQSAVSTLIVAPLTYSKHGRPYTVDEFSESDEDDLEKDTINSAGFLQFIQLPTSNSKVEIEVPETSEGWQLLAAATKGKLESADELEDAVIYYIGFTEQAFENADDFNDANVSYELRRHCDQETENQPKGCAAFNRDKEPVVTHAVEIHRIDINGSEQADGGNPFPWIVRSVDGGNNEATVSDAMNYMNTVVGAFTGTITNITVYVTHQESSGASAACSATPNNASSATFSTNCGGYQTYSRDY